MKSKVIAVVSNVAGNGGKYVATELAHELKDRHKGSHVLLIDFDFEQPYLASALTKHDSVHGIDNLLNHMAGGELSDAMFEENLIETKGKVYVLRGVRTTEKGKLLSRIQVETIINKAKKLFDYIYIVINPRSNNAGSLLTLMNADRVLVVLRNNEANDKTITKTIKLIRQYSMVDKIYLVYNFKNLHSKVRLNNKLDPEEERIIGILNYIPNTIDNIHQLRSGVFRGSKNTGIIRKINKIMLEAGERQSRNKRTKAKNGEKPKNKEAKNETND